MKQSLIYARCASPYDYVIYRQQSECQAFAEQKLKGYLDILREQGTIRTFNQALWCGTVEQVRILKDGTMRFILKDGAKVEG